MLVFKRKNEKLKKDPHLFLKKHLIFSGKVIWLISKRKFSLSRRKNDFFLRFAASLKPQLQTRWPEYNQARFVDRVDALFEAFFHLSNLFF